MSSRPCFPHIKTLSLPQIPIHIFPYPLQFPSILLLPFFLIGVYSPDNPITSQIHNRFGVYSQYQCVKKCVACENDETEEECQELKAKVKSGLLKKLELVELEEKAKSLHRDIKTHCFRES